MSGYEEFQMIMANINYQIQHNETKKKNVSDNDSLEYLKNLFGI